MTNPQSPKAKTAAKSNRKVHLVRSGSVTVKIYELTRAKGDYCTVCWHIGPKRYRQNFKTLDQAKKFAKDKAEALAAGQVNAPSMTVADAQTYQEAVRRFGPHKIPIHVVAGEYASAADKLKDAGTLRQAVEFFLHNTTRTELQRTVPQVVEKIVKVKQRNGLSQRYIEDLRNRLTRFAADFQVPISTVQTREIGDWVRRLNCSPRSRNNFRKSSISPRHQRLTPDAVADMTNFLTKLTPAHKADENAQTNTHHRQQRSA